jgi:hypothetical protein
LVAAAERVLAPVGPGRAFRHLPGTRAAIGAVLAEHATGGLEAVVLTRAATDAPWFAALAGVPRCYVRGRLRCPGYPRESPHASLVFYLGPRPERFAAEFATWGVLEGIPRDGPEAHAPGVGTTSENKKICPAPQTRGYWGASLGRAWAWVRSQLRAGGPCSGKR